MNRSTNLKERDHADVGWERGFKSHSIQEDFAGEVSWTSKRAEVLFFQDGETRTRTQRNRATPTDQNSLWVRLAKTADTLRKQVHHDTINSSPSKNDLNVVDLEYAAHLLPSLVTRNGKLRTRKQQDKHRGIKSKAVLTYLRKVEKAAAQTILLAGEGSNQGAPLPATAQTAWGLNWD